MTDGPHGVRSNSGPKSPNVYFPATIGLAATWNPILSWRIWVLFGQETKEAGCQVILAPGINIMPTPLCGRNFEYLAEDPYLVSQMVIPIIKGIQDEQVAACVKHYCCNNSEVRRRFSNSMVSERALHEIYLPGFEVCRSGS